MNNIDIQKRKIGISFNDQKDAEVLVWAPLSKQVSIILTNKDLEIPLVKEEHGYWSLTTPELQPGECYQFRLADDVVTNDPASLYQPADITGPSCAIDTSDFNWTDDQWKNPLLNDYIIYELHTGTFTNEGTFEAISEKLDHLIELGITAVELMPIGQFPDARNWGYDGVFPFAVQKSYGGVRALQQLVDTCHQKGLAVILDVVYNHTGPEGSVFLQYGPYFTSKYCTPWGDAVNFDDAGSDAVRRYFIENALMWLRDFHIDALRMDAVHAIKDFSPVHILKDIRGFVNQLYAATGRTHYLIVECDLNDTRFINATDKNGGYGMDSQWNDEFHHALRVTAGEERRGYYTDFEGIADLAKAYKDAYVFDGRFSAHRDKTFGERTDNPGGQFIVFSQNHDQIGNRVLGERTSKLVSFEMQKLIAAAVLAAPFLPMLFMGEEWGESNSFQYFISHFDQQLVEGVRNGRKEEFASFVSGDEEVPDPQAEKAYQQSKLQWDIKKHEPHATLLRYYKKLISMRKLYPALNRLERQNVDVVHNVENKTLLLHRWYGQQHIICLMNFSENPQSVSITAPAKQWSKILDSAAPQWKGQEAAPNSVENGAEVLVQPESIIMYIADEEL